MPPEPPDGAQELSSAMRGRAMHLGLSAFCISMAAAVLAGMCAPALAADSAGVKSNLRAIRPAVSGLKIQVTGGDRFLIMRNGTKETILVRGYDDEPYLRFLPNRVVQENTRSPSKYVNDDRYGLTPVPPQANSKAAPKWNQVSDNGSYRWFDHRIHLMEKGTPPQVKDKGKETKIFDWRVPLNVGSRPAAAVGTLTWEPASSSSGSSSGPIIAIVAVVVLIMGGAAWLLSRRRKGTRPTGPSSSEDKPAKEAW